MSDKKWFKIGEVATMWVAEDATECRVWSGAPQGANHDRRRLA